VVKKQAGNALYRERPDWWSGPHLIASGNY
jgi:hypothetical protein